MITLLTEPFEFMLNRPRFEILIISHLKNPLLNLKDIEVSIRILNIHVNKEVISFMKMLQLKLNQIFMFVSRPQ